MRVLVACEFSGIVRQAFARRGHMAISCDFLDTELPGPHMIGDVRQLLTEDWDLMIAFPPCRYLTKAGNRWWPERQSEQRAALSFVRELLAAPIPRIALENPVGKINTAIRNPDQIINPWQFGHAVNKATCLWLKNLPALKPTGHIAVGRRTIDTVPGLRRDRWKERSRTFVGIAEAMADQWG